MNQRLLKILSMRDNIMLKKKAKVTKHSDFLQLPTRKTLQPVFWSIKKEGIPALRPAMILEKITFFQIALNQG